MNIKFIDSPDFLKVEKQCIDTFSSTYGMEVNTFRLLRQTSNSYLFELTLLSGTKHQRLVLATHEELPSSINLPDYINYFNESPVLDETKSIQIIRFDNEYKYVDYCCYGYNKALMKDNTPKE